jgi:hypothetical protein
VSVEGRPIPMEVLGDGPGVLLFLAVIHGNEPAGAPLLHHLSRHLRLHPELLTDRSVILIPIANPDGMVHGTRGNSNGVDLCIPIVTVELPKGVERLTADALWEKYGEMLLVAVNPGEATTDGTRPEPGDVPRSPE